MTTEVARPDERYVSIFEDPGRFGAQMKVAEMLSRTAFVPKAFQGKPEDCLVALDMAGRLELNPLAVFPDIYVIDGRSSFSSKFLIALVNRSGRFSRIQFDCGTDGTAEVTYGAWEYGSKTPKKTRVVVPNVYAVASFSDLTTGERYESPRVDMAFADRNGWVEKPGSKWQTMPEIMTRYRAASILIKSVCPEIVMGLEFADDLLDAREDVPARQVVREPKPLPDARDDKVVERLESCIRKAADADELNAVAKTVQEFNLDKDEAQRLRKAYREKRTELMSVIPPKAGLPGEELFNANAAHQAIHDATTDERLDEIRNEIDEANADGRVRERDYNELVSSVARKKSALLKQEVEEGLPDDDDATDEQLKKAETIRTGMLEAAKSLDAARLDRCGQTINDWTEQGILTEMQGRTLYAQFEELRRELNHGV